MSFYIREGLNVGPVRFNLSKSGIGASLGVKGFRFGTGPKGEYVYVGEGPVRYRKYKQLGSSEETGSQPRENGTSSGEDRASSTGPQTVEKSLEDTGELEDPDEADASSLVETGSEDIINEINAARDRWRMWPFAAVVSGILLFLSLIMAAVGAAVTVLLYKRDQVRKTVALFYDFSDEAKKQYKAVCRIFAGAAESDEIWNAEVGFSSPGSVKTNVPIPSFSFEKQSIYFFPERILIENKDGPVEVLSYENVKVSTSSATKRRKSTLAPIDAKVVEKTWKHSNKDGSRDKRYKDNPRMSKFKVEQIRLRGGPNGSKRMRMKVGFSRTGVTEVLSEAIHFLPVRLTEKAEKPKLEGDASEELEELTETFLEDFDDEQRQQAINDLESPEAVKYLRSLWTSKMEREESTQELRQKALNLHGGEISPEEKSVNGNNQAGSGSAENVFQNLKGGTKREKLDPLIETFLEDLNDKQRQKVIDKLDTKNPDAAELLRSVWKSERNANRAEEIADEFIDLVN